MRFLKELTTRSNQACELSGNTNELVPYLVAPKTGESSNDYILITKKLADQLNGASSVNPNDWRCLADSMWSEVPAVKVVSYRMLDQLKTEGWPTDLLEQFYSDDETLNWAKATLEDEDAIKHIDSNGVVLKSGDTVVLIKDLDVKGSSITAKRGTAVRNIKLVYNDANLIEGKVEGQSIYILTQFVKK